MLTDRGQDTSASPIEGQALQRLPEVLTVAEAGKILRVSKNVMYEAIRRGRIPCIRMGRRILIPQSAMRKLLGEEGSEC
jgi:excisionase family DNA binding protein